MDSYKWPRGCQRLPQFSTQINKYLNAGEDMARGWSAIFIFTSISISYTVMPWLIVEELECETSFLGIFFRSYIPVCANPAFTTSNVKVSINAVGTTRCSTAVVGSLLKTRGFVSGAFFGLPLV